MNVRELSPDEWTNFFDCFSRRFRGQPMTLRVTESDGGGERILAGRLPLVGITCEPANGPQAIEVILGDSPDENVVHVVRCPAHVRIAQIRDDGQDEQVIIEQTTGETAFIDIQ